MKASARHHEWVCWTHYERQPPWVSQRLCHSPALGLDHQIPPADPKRRGRKPSAGSDPRELRQPRGGNLEGPCGQGPHPTAGLHPASGANPPFGAVTEGKGFVQVDEEVSAFEEDLWGRHLWACGDFECSTGNETDNMIKEYVSRQSHEPTEDFRVED